LTPLPPYADKSRAAARSSNFLSGFTPLAFGQKDHSQSSDSFISELLLLGGFAWKG